MLFSTMWLILSDIDLWQKTGIENGKKSGLAYRAKYVVLVYQLDEYLLAHVLAVQH